MPIQGFGSSILRKAIQLAQDKGLKVIIPLHDALYIEGKVETHKEDLETLIECMREAFAFYFKDDMRSKAYELIKFDAVQWGPNMCDGLDYHLDDGTPVKVQEVYIDPRAKKEYERFKKYMEI